MNVQQAVEKIDSMRAKLYRCTSDMLHPVLAACRDAQNKRDLHQRIASYNRHKDETNGWGFFNDPEKTREEFIAHEVEARLDWIIADMRFKLMAAQDDELYRDAVNTRAAALAALRSF